MLATCSAGCRCLYGFAGVDVCCGRGPSTLIVFGLFHCCGASRYTHVQPIVSKSVCPSKVASLAAGDGGRGVTVGCFVYFRPTLRPATTTSPPKESRNTLQSPHAKTCPAHQGTMQCSTAMQTRNQEQDRPKREKASGKGPSCYSHVPPRAFPRWPVATPANAMATRATATRPASTVQFQVFGPIARPWLHRRTHLNKAIVPPSRFLSRLHRSIVPGSFHACLA